MKNSTCLEKLLDLLDFINMGLVSHGGLRVVSEALIKHVDFRHENTLTVFKIHPRLNWIPVGELKGDWV